MNLLMMNDEIFDRLLFCLHELGGLSIGALRNVPALLLFMRKMLKM